MKALFAVTNTERLGDTDEATGFQLSEATHPLAEFDAAGIEVEFVSPRGGRAPIHAADRDDPLNAAFLDDPRRLEQVEHTLSPEDIDAGEYDALLYVGGHGTMWDFPHASDLAQIAARIYELGGVVGAVCHGPAGLLPIRTEDGRPLVEGKRVAAFTDEEEVAVGRDGVIPFSLAKALGELGAEHVPAPNWTANVVVDGRLVTGQNPQSATGVGDRMVALLAAAPVR